MSIKAQLQVQRGPERPSAQDSRCESQPANSEEEAGPSQRPLLPPFLTQEASGGLCCAWRWLQTTCGSSQVMSSVILDKDTFF